jgi:nucleotide-binding universal stress UspA family protein
MYNSFKNILIPVDLSINTEVAVKKGLELADKGTTIHLLNVQSDSLPGITSSVRKYFMSVNQLADDRMIEQKLEEWKQSIEERTTGITVCSWIILENSIQKGIEKKARQLAVDLIIIGKSSHHSYFPFLNTIIPSRIVQKTGITVLTVKPGSINNKIRTVIVPIASEATKNKMEVIATICRKFKVKIHLVIFINSENEQSGFYASSLLQVYQWLKSSIHCPVEYAVLHGQNKAKAILHYAEKINADILLVDPVTETKIGWLNKHISDVLPPASKVQVLTIQPATTFN